MSGTSSRRGLFSRAGALIATATAFPPGFSWPAFLWGTFLETAPGAIPTGVLLGLCHRFHQTHAEVETAPTDSARKAITARRWTISDQIETTPAITPAEKAAKARVALLLLEECGDTAHPGSWERLVTVALAEAAGIPIPPASVEKRNLMGEVRA